MQDISKLCMICLSVKDENNICPRCKKNISVKQDTPLLPLKSILSERYCIAKAMKKNGEGVTYAAYDLKTDRPVSVREFFPESIASRSLDELSVIPASGGEGDFSRCRASFIELWTKLMRLNGVSALVTVTDVFQTNSTAYAVYEESELVNLNNYLNNTEDGFMTWEKARILFMPVFSTLGTLHTSGVIHRGINPKSFIFSKDGKLKLTDFCTEQARTLLSDIEPELFEGYTPYEQYSTSGNIGTWSDIYSFCAVIYRTLTGKDPIDSKIRAEDDKLMIPAKFAELIPPHVVNTLINGMQIDPADRAQNVEQLRSILSSGQRSMSDPIYTRNSDHSKYTSADPSVISAENSSTLPPFEPERDDNPISSYGSYAQRMQGLQPDMTVPVVPADEAPVPPRTIRTEQSDYDSPVNGFVSQIPEAEKTAAENDHAPYTSNGGGTLEEREEDYRAAVAEVRRIEAEKSAKNKKIIIAVLSTIIVILLAAGGFIVKELVKGGFLTLGGIIPSSATTANEQEITVPNFKTHNIADILKNENYTNNFTINQVEESSPTIAKGIVMNQDIEPNTKVPKGSIITLYVSSGPEMTEIEDVVGLTYEMAEKRLTKQGFKCSKSYKQNDGTHPANTVAETSPLGGSMAKSGSLIMVVLWKEAETEATTSAVIDISDQPRTTVTTAPTTAAPTTAKPTESPTEKPTDPTEKPSEEPIEEPEGDED